jgi:predicted metal-dependent hydrolase
VIKFAFKIERTRKFAGSTTIKVSAEKGVVVRAPFWVPEGIIKRFIEDRSDWIEKHLKRFNSVSTPEKKYVEGETHLYFGEEHPLVFFLAATPVRTTVGLSEKTLQITVYQGHVEDKRQSEVKNALLRWYLETGVGIITEKVNFYSQQLGVEYSRIDLKKVSSIWGSCSASNKLSFNRKLIMAPHRIVDYVVIHEVCHMVHRDHSSRFWALVSRFDHNYKEHRRWLKNNHHLLSI